MEYYRDWVGHPVLFYIVYGITYKINFRNEGYRLGVLPLLTVNIVVDRLIKDNTIKLRLTATKNMAKKLGLDDTTREIIFLSKKVDEDRYLINSIENGETNPSDIKTYDAICDMLSVYTDIEILEEPKVDELFVIKDKKKEEEAKEKEEELKKEDLAKEKAATILKSLDEPQSYEVEELKKAILSEEPKVIQRKRVGKGCEKCDFTGWKQDSLTGIKVRCDCQIRAERQTKIKDTEAPKVKIRDKDKLRLLVPLERRKDEFDTDTSKHNIEEIAKMQNCKIYRYTTYIDTINTILGEIVTSGLKNSYIIGAPNGFGKTTFVYTAIKRLLAQNKKVVPYLPLIELAEKKVEYEARLMEKLKNPRFAGELRKEPDEFIWKDFVEADVLFTFFSSIESKEIESAALSALMTLRASKGRPTIACISTSLNLYTNDTKLREYYWDDMIAYKTDTTKVGVDRLIHRSCYKRYNGNMTAIKGIDY